MSQDTAQLDGSAHIVITGFVVTLAVVIVIATLQGMGSEVYNELCHDRAGPAYEYAKNVTTNETTIGCKAPNGTVRKVSALVNSTA
jgi:hypothetical protein